jgi:heme exporter protein CcmD
MTTHLHFLVASYAVFALAIAIEVISLILSRRRALNAVEMDNEQHD